MADITDITVTILREIRDEIRTTRDYLGRRIDETNSRLDETNSRLDGTNSRLDTLTGAVGELAEQQRFIVKMLGAGMERDRRLEGEVGELRARVEAIESRLGSP